MGYSHEVGSLFCCERERAGSGTNMGDTWRKGVGEENCSMCHHVAQESLNLNGYTMHTQIVDTQRTHK